MPTCSLCGSQHDTENGVVQHIYMSSKGDHADWPDKGEIWKNSDELVNDNDVPTGSSGGDGGGSSDPTMGSGGGSSSSSSTFETPCGHEEVDVDDIPEAAIRDGKTVWTCGTCGEAWEVEVA